jgi:hypothetical protein
VAIPRRIPVAFEDVFPHGAYVLGVEPVNDYAKAKAKAGLSDPQERDRTRTALLAYVDRLRGTGNGAAA